MARGGRSRGRVGRGRFGRGGIHSSHPHYGRGSNSGALFLEIAMDAIAARPGQAVLLQDTLYLSGNSSTVITRLDNFAAIQPTQYIDPMGMDMMGGMNAMNNTMGGMDPNMVGVNPNPLNTNEPFL